jgi:hypothetical protein
VTSFVLQVVIGLPKVPVSDGESQQLMLKDLVHSRDVCVLSVDLPVDRSTGRTKGRVCSRVASISLSFHSLARFLVTELLSWSWIRVWEQLWQRPGWAR